MKNNDKSIEPFVGRVVLLRTRTKRVLTTITKVTPSGRFQVNALGAEYFNKNGSLRGGYLYDPTHVYFLSDEEIQEFKEEVGLSNLRKHVKTRLNECSSNLTEEQLKSILDILGEKEEETE